MPEPAARGEPYELPFLHLDTLWLQVSGTLCNIACKHCFISCGPKVRTHDLMTVQQCVSALTSAGRHGLREVWFTGGEPFLHPDILALIDEALAVAPLGILTNGMLIDEAMADALAHRFRRGPYTLEIRVSLDGASAEVNDRVRGRGVFERATGAIRLLAERGLEPIVAVTQLDQGGADRQAFVELLRELGVQRPRVKWIPAFRIGREAGRDRGYEVWEALAAGDLHSEAFTSEDNPSWHLQCGTSRTVTTQGVFPCPILINHPDRRLGDSLEQALRGNRVDHAACYTCWVEGFSCST